MVAVLASLTTVGAGYRAVVSPYGRISLAAAPDGEQGTWDATTLAAEIVLTLSAYRYLAEVDERRRMVTVRPISVSRGTVGQPVLRYRAAVGETTHMLRARVTNPIQLVASLEVELELAFWGLLVMVPAPQLELVAVDDPTNVRVWIP